MSEIHTLNQGDVDVEKDRIALWRSERSRVAEQEKALRIEARETARLQAASEAATLRQRAARSLIPTEDELTRTHNLIHKRHRRERLRLKGQFAVLVFLPVLLCLFYLTMIATPLYEARSVIAITKPGAASEQNANGLLGALNGPTNLQEVFMAHEYVQSQAMMDALENATGLVATLSSDKIDPAQRLRDLPGLPISKHDQFGRFVESAVNIQTGMITLYVRVPSRDDAVAISDVILGQTANQINALNDELFDQRLAFAEVTVVNAQQQLSSAQADLVSLQIKSREVDPRVRVAAIYENIRQLEANALALNSDVQKAQIAGRGETFLAQQTAELETRIRGQIDVQRQLLVSDSDGGGTSLNAVLMQYEMADLRVRVAEERVTTALAGLAQASKAAALGRSLFQVVVPPRTSEAATFPNTPSVMLVVTSILTAMFVFVRLLRSGRRAGIT